MLTALLFPGQGSQTPGMRELAERYAPELAEIVIAEAGPHAFERADRNTAAAQPAIVCATVAAWRGAGSPSGAALAGHSLGEISALAAAEAIDPADAVRLAAVRGRAMAEAAAAHPGAMVALLGDADQSRRLANDCDVAIANDNGPTQLVASGSRRSIDELLDRASRRGVKTVRLSIAGPFHTDAVAGAVPRFRRALGRVRIEGPVAPVYSSYCAAPFPDDPDLIRERLAAAITGTVRWRETLNALWQVGVRDFVEVGPGRALTNTVRRSLAGARAASLDAEPIARV